MNICPECFDNSILKRRIRDIRPRFPDDEKCEIHPSRKGVPLEEVGRVIDPALRANYVIGEWMFEHQEGDDLSLIVGETTGADDDRVIEGLVSWLIDNDTYWPPDGEYGFYADDQSYVLIKPDGWHHSALWRRFREDILHRQRFFNDSAKEFLAEIFDGVQQQADIANKPAFYRIDPEEKTEFFRARIVTTEESYDKMSKDPAGQMGPPPPGLRTAGRMNAAGIAVFYGAVEQETAIAELRPAVGSIVCFARFKLRRSIHVLDLTRFRRPGKHIDIFAKNQLKRTTQWAFMQSFAAEISQPILPGDEHLEYVPAQVVAEYLTGQPIPWRGNEVIPDAIIFRSAQNSGGNNIAIMGDAAEVFVNADDQRAKEGPSAVGLVDFEFLDFASPSLRTLNPALEYVADSLERYEITSAKYGTETYFSSPIGMRDDF